MTDVMQATPQEIWGNILITGLFTESSQDNIVATAGGGQAGAVPLTKELSRIATVATAGDSVALPPAVAGLSIIVVNHGANAMQVFGNAATGDTINDSATATGVSQMAGSEVIYGCATNGKWYANGLGTGYAGSFETQSTSEALTAHAGGGQGSALPITSMVSRFSVVGSAGDSAVLPVGVQGMTITVINSVATSMNVFPASGGTINGGSANAQVAVTNAAPTIFFCTSANNWWTK